jgi:hypothetical protein
MQITIGTIPGRPRIGFRPIGTSRGGKEKSKEIEYLLDFICFLIPASNFLTFKLIGMLPAGELIALLLLIPCLLSYWGSIWRGRSKTIYFMMGMWLLAQIVSDFYNHSPFENAAKGEALILFLALDFTVLSALAYKNYRRILYFGIGNALGVAIGFYLAPEEYNSLGDSAASWKFGYAPIFIFTTIIVGCYFYKKRRYSIVAFLIFGIAAVNLAQNYRSQVLILFSAGILIMPISTWIRRHSGLKLSSRSVEKDITLMSAFTRENVLVLSLMAFGAFGVTKTYSLLASAGALGADAQLKYEAQSRGKLGLLIGGRPETLVSIRAAMDSPLVGHGSWAADPKYIEMLSDVSAETGYVSDEGAAQADADYLIPTHSYLMGAWVFSGITGAIFWAYIYYLVILGILKLLVFHPPLSPYIGYWLVSGLWNILFSPFGQGARMDVAITLVMICTVLQTDMLETPPVNVSNRRPIIMGKIQGVPRAMPRSRS